jgi:hypothetical protein
MSNNVRFSAAVQASLAVDGEAMDHDCSGELGNSWGCHDGDRTLSDRTSCGRSLSASRARIGPPGARRPACASALGHRTRRACANARAPRHRTETAREPRNVAGKTRANFITSLNASLVIRLAADESGARASRSPAGIQINPIRARGGNRAAFRHERCECPDKETRPQRHLTSCFYRRTRTVLRRPLESAQYTSIEVGNCSRSPPNEGPILPHCSLPA